MLISILVKFSAQHVDVRKQNHEGKITIRGGVDLFLLLLDLNPLPVMPH